MSGEVSSGVFLVAGTKPWSRRVYDDFVARIPGKWRYVSEREQLSTAFLGDLHPRYIFFLHWSWLVPDDIIYTEEDWATAQTAPSEEGA